MGCFTTVFVCNLTLSPLSLSLSPDFAIANVQCQYDGDAEEAPRPLIDHNYDRADEPPAFIIQQVNVSSLPLGGAPLAAPKFMTIAPGALPAVNVIHVADQRQVQEQPQETNMNKRIRRSEEVLKEAADCVSRGLTFQTVSERFNIPISTIRFFMARKGILPRRRRGRHGHISTVSSRSPEPPFHMQHYKLPHMLALAADCDQDNE
ncbi:hypothetical protein JYU34_021993 [Plutella xylostella]|uniref:HTH psq-type domain-containing protein n=1 Tax=Plutella xylostella TaxID=51655 RepID=A0ABQ7PS29_PLUXY|nr:hypothetical protein JYU34_021993 [Plutella xylostella]